MEIISALLLMVSVLAGNLYKLSFYSADVHIGLIDIIAGLGVFLALLSGLKKILSHIASLRLISLPLFSFLAWCLASLSWVYLSYGNQGLLVAFFYFLRLLVFSLLIFVLAMRFHAGHLIRLLYIFGSAIVTTGALQYLLFPDIRHLQIAEWDPHYYRAVGTLLDPGFMGIILVLFLILQLRYPLANRLHHWLGLVITYIIFALTYSRSSYLALLAASVSISIIKKSWRPFFFTLLLLLLTFTVLPRSPDGEGVKLERTSSIRARIQNWTDSLTIIVDRPLNGVGYNAYRYAQKRAGIMDNYNWLRSHSGAGADSSLLFITATTGLIGLFLYLNYLKALLSLKTISYELTALLVHSLFLNSLVYPFVLLWLAGLIAVSIRIKAGSPPSTRGWSGSRPGRSQPL